MCIIHNKKYSMEGCCPRIITHLLNQRYKAQKNEQIGSPASSVFYSGKE